MFWRSSDGDGGERLRLADREPAEQRRVGAAADHDRESEPAGLADVLAVGLVVDRDHGRARVPQRDAQPQPDLPEPDDDHVVGASAPRAGRRAR